MKLLLKYILVLSLTGCTSKLAEFGGGTLGAKAIHTLNCPLVNVEHELDSISMMKEFEVAIQDTNITNWWKEGGYEFLNYRCMNIQEKLYMITIDNQDSSYTDISIRSFYSRIKKEWIYAVEFNPNEINRAEKDMQYLLKNISLCQ